MKLVKAKRQQKHVDALITVVDQIDNEFIFLIEDKVGTGVHSNQLQRYYDTLLKDVEDTLSKECIYPIYINTHNINHTLLPDFSEYQEFYRKDFLKVLEQYNGNNAILKDFYNYLLEMEINTESFASTAILPEESWKGLAWQGFFMSLIESLQMGNWHYVNNRSGGFYGCYFGGVPAYIKEEGSQKQIGRIYILLQENKLGIELGLNSEYKGKAHSEERRKLRNRAYHYLKKVLGTDFTKPSKFGNGQNMTLLNYKDQDYRIVDEKTGYVSVTRTAEKLKLIADSLKSHQDLII